MPSGTLSVVHVASYNVHRCIGTDRRHDPLRVAEVIRELHADVIGLQEVNSRFHGEGAVDQVDYLRRRTGMEAVAGPCLIHLAGHSGNVILTRWPIRSVCRYDLSVPGREPRAALEAVIVLDRTAVRVVVTHFGLRQAERAVQAATLTRALQSPEPVPAIVIGDFNRWVPGERSLECLDRRLGPSRSVRSFPAYFPVLALERIWVEAPNRLERVVAHRSGLARRASDHLPLKATILLGDKTVAAQDDSHSRSSYKGPAV